MRFLNNMKLCSRHSAGVSRRLIFGLCLQAILLLSVAQNSVAAADEPSVAGQVELVDGDVKVVDRAGVVRVPTVQDKIFEGDTLLCANSGELHVRMQDQGYIAVRPNTQLKIVIYQAKGADSDGVAFSLIKGTFRSITGWVGNLNRSSYKVKTANATLGVRGTDHEPLFVPESSPVNVETNLAGTYDKVNTGATFIENDFGKIEVEPQQVGFAPLEGKLRLLPKAPALYLHTKHEGRIDERKEQLQRSIKVRLRDGVRRSDTGEAAPDDSMREKIIEKIKDKIDQNDPLDIKPRRRRR